MDTYEDLAFKNINELAGLNKNDLLNIIAFLQTERKLWLNQFTKTHNESVDMQKENKELKKKYENAVADYETTMAEKNELKYELKKQVEEKENIACNWKDSCLENAGKIEILETQQKEFINYLEDEIKIYSNTYMGDMLKELKEVLQKYKEIIRVLDEKEN